MADSNNKQMNIAMIGQKRVPSREGGVEIVVEEISARMAERGMNVTCYNRQGHHVAGKENDLGHFKEYRGIRMKEAWTIQGKGLAAFSASFFGAVAAMFSSYDVVHFHAEGPALFCFIPRITGKRVVVTVHGLDHQRAKWGNTGRKVILAGEKMAVKCAHEVIVLSKGVKDYFADTYGREVHFIPNGVNRPELAQCSEITKNWGLTKDSYILFLGRLVPEKGIHYLIEAYKRINTDKKLVIAGGSSDSMEYSESLMKEASDNIIFTGFRQGEVLKELYSNAYIYCLPSDLEGMPLSLLEAMSYGNCCLVSSIDECTEVVTDKAAVFEKGNVDSLTAVLGELCDNPDRVAEYKAGAADYICDRYDWDKVVDQTIRLYDKH